MGVVRDTVGILVKIALIAFVIGLVVGLYFGVRVGMEWPAVGASAMDLRRGV